METALLNYFVLNDRLRSTCDFNAEILVKGISIYEVLRVEGGIPVFLREHIERFFSSARLEKVTLDVSEKFIRQAIRNLISENRMARGNIKFLFSQDKTGERRFMAWVTPFFYPAEQHYRQGVVVGRMPGERENPNAKKSLPELRRKADELRKEKGWWEVIYVNRKGFVTEGSRSNVFFVREDRLETPEITLVLPGITRAKVLQLARDNGIRAIEKQIPLAALSSYDACFLTGTSPKLLPVKQWDGFSFSVDNAVMRLLMKKYDEMVAEDIRRFSW
jgi:branched-chain amino acid aminotransferase